MIIDDVVGLSITLQFSAKARELKAQGRDLISLGLGEPNFDTPQHITQAAVDALHAGLTKYSAAPGIPQLRELTAQALRNGNSIDADPARITITPGAKMGLFVACAAVLRPGDEVINFNPCYVSNNPILKLAEPQCTIHNVPLLPGSFAIDQQQVAALMNDNTKLIFINYPNNPTGRMLREAELAFLSEMACKHDACILSDEIYEKIVLGEQRQLSPAASEDIADRVITVGGFSKAYAMTGWRIGYVHANPQITSTIVKIHQQLNTNTPVFIQKAAVSALEGPQDHLAQFLNEMRERKQLYEDTITANQHLTGSNIDGGFFGFVDISSTGLSSDDFCTQLLDETDVAVLPGISFGADFDDWFRISLVNETSQVAEGLRRISQFTNALGGSHA